MARKTIVLLASTEEVLQKMGERIRRARLRRNISAEKIKVRVQIRTSIFVPY